MFAPNEWQQLVGIILYGGADLWVLRRIIIMAREKDYEL